MSGVNCVVSKFRQFAGKFGAKEIEPAPVIHDGILVGPAECGDIDPVPLGVFSTVAKNQALHRRPIRADFLRDPAADSRAALRVQPTLGSVDIRAAPISPVVQTNGNPLFPVWPATV